jgi:hypothetical protein
LVEILPGPVQIPQMAIVHAEPNDGSPLMDQRILSRISVRHLFECLFAQVDGLDQVSHLVGQVGTDGGGISGDWNLGSPGTMAFCDLQQWFNRVQLPDKEYSPGVPHAKHGIALAQVGGQLIDPPQKAVWIVAHNRRGGDLLHQEGSTFHVASRQGMLDSIVHRALSLIPLAGTAMQLGDASRLPFAQPPLQEIGKQVVVSVPTTLIVQWDQEEVFVFELTEDLPAGLYIQHGIAERGAETLQDRRPAQKSLDGLGLARHDLVHQVIDHVSMAA